MNEGYNGWEIRVNINDSVGWGENMWKVYFERHLSEDEARGIGGGKSSGDERVSNKNSWMEI